MNAAKSKRILGMTISQVAFLAIMACFVCASLAIFGGFIANNPSKNSSLPTLYFTNTPALLTPPTRTVTLPSPATATLQPTDTFVLLPSATATDTSTSSPTETATPQPSAALAGPLRVYFVDVGQGDAILIVSPDGSTVLIDGGDTNTGILQFLQGLGIQHIDLMVATHPHADHIGGLVQVLNAMPVSRVVTNGQLYTTATFEHFLDAIVAAKIPFIVAKRGDTLAVGNLSFSVLSPVDTSGDDLNNNSLVLRLVYGEVSFLFMGDAQTNAEAGILAAGLPVQSTILKVGHHGSNTSSSPAFLAQVKPAVAIYSAGVGNSYGHPRPETLAALAAVGAQIYGTDANGTVTVTTDGFTYEVNVQKGGPRAPPAAVLPTVTPGILSSPTAAQGTLSIDILYVTSPASRGQTVTLSARTSPGANCTITVYYKSGPSHASGLESKTADADGSISWSWKVGVTTTPGTWRIVVTATLNGQTETTETTFTVTE